VERDDRVGGPGVVPPVVRAGESIVELEEPPLATKPRSPRKLVGWTSLGVIVLLAVAGAPTVAGYLVIPAVVVTIAAPWIARRLR